MEARTGLTELLSRLFGLALAVQWLESAVVVVIHVEDVVLVHLNASIRLKDDLKPKLEMGMAPRAWSHRPLGYPRPSPIGMPSSPT